MLPYRARTVFRFFLPYRFYRERDRYRTVFRLTVRSAKRTEPLIVTARVLVFDREPHRDPYCISFGAVRIAVRFAVLNNKRITVSILVRYGSRSNTKTRTVTINGSVRFALLTVSLKNGTVTVAVAVKNGTVKKNGKRYGKQNGKRYGHGGKFGPPTVYMNILRKN